MGEVVRYVIHCMAVMCFDPVEINLIVLAEFVKRLDGVFYCFTPNFIAAQSRDGSLRVYIKLDFPVSSPYDSLGSRVDCRDLALKD